MTRREKITCLLSCVLPLLVCPGKAGAQSVESVKKPQLVLAHYMPWYTAKPFSDHWGWHWTMDHFAPDKETDGKRQIASKFYPIIGPYD